MIKKTNGSEIFRIRGHHLLCILGFQGYGYSKDFTDHMASIINQIQKNSHSRIKVVVGVDLICKHCPNRVENVCKQDDAVNQKTCLMDSLTIQKLGLKEGSVIKASSIYFLVKKLEKDDVMSICGVCSWRSKCLFFQGKYEDSLLS